MPLTTHHPAPGIFMTPKLNFRPTLFAFATALTLSAFTATGFAQVAGVANSRVAPAADPGSQRAALARADSAWEAGGYLLAAQLYEAILARDSSSHIALYRLATLRSWDNRFDEGIALFRRYIAVEPDYTEGRMALARTIAWSGRYSSAIAIYDSVLTRQPTYRDAVLGRAQTLAWAGSLKEALSAYKQWVTAHPTDRNASIDYARALAWNGQMDEAETMYTQLAKTGNANAKKGLARVIGWRGELERSERTWREVLATDPADPEALTGLAQVLSWQGRQGDAETALQAALRANPAYGDARTLLRWVQADLRPSVSVSGIGVNDSDHNRSTSFVLDYIGRAPWNGTVGAKYVERWANFAAIDSRADAASFFGRWQPAATSWQFRADAGVTRHSTSLVATTAQKTIANGALSASGKVGRSLTLRMGASRAPFDETALLIASGVVSSEMAGEAEIALPSRFTLSGAASHARLTGGTRDNTRNAFSSTLRWTRSRSWSLAVGARQFGYDTTSSDGYFAPKRYTLAEASARGRIGGQQGWNADADVGLGQQRIEFFGSNEGSRMAERVAMSLGYRFDPAHEVSAAGGYANIAAPGQTSGSEYKWYTFSLRARFGF
jgi:tetratricopeptide (TPR) repeat protein